MTAAYVRDEPALLEEAFDEELVCTDVLSVTHDVATFVLSSPVGRLFGFRPGQYLTVHVDAFGVPLERCYTISSAPTRPESLAITVKRTPGGPMSNWLHDHLEVGARLRVSGPLGDFTLDAHPATRHLFLSAGSGATPMMSMTRTLNDLSEPHDVVFVHSARSPADIVFRRELEQMHADGAGIAVATVCETDPGDPTWHGVVGRLTRAMLERLVPDLLQREIFTCGPPLYLESVRVLLDEAGVDPARVHRESFLLGSRTDPDLPPPGAAPPGVAPYSVELRRSGRTVVCDGRTTVLQAAAAAGIALPSSCGEGVCGTCRTTLLAGSVDMQHGGGIRPREIALQQVLLCCSRPLEDLVVDA
ncbi:MAG: hybrid-cluster NAD(P)-dependent oxidoreductase [Nocardioidaceae bacterium]